MLNCDYMSRYTPSTNREETIRISRQIRPHEGVYPHKFQLHIRTPEGFPVTIPHLLYDNRVLHLVRYSVGCIRGLLTNLRKKRSIL